MGNYKHFESEFVERTLHLIGQYESILYKYDFNNQYNFTLLTNCLLGLIVIPKEKAFDFLPNERIVSQLKKDMGIVHSSFNSDIKDLRSLITEMRNSISHSDIRFISNDDEEFLIDEIQFRDKHKGKNYIIASFVPSELLSFIRYYGGWFIKNIKHHDPKLFAD